MKSKESTEILSKKIKNVQRDLEGLEDNFDSEKRRTRRDLSDIKKQLKNA